MKDSVFADTEMEDSMSTFTVMSVEKPKTLLRQCWKRLRKDLRQNHSKRQYLYKNVSYNSRRYPFVTASQTYTVGNDDGIRLFNRYDRNMTEEWGAVNAKASYPLNQNDSSNLSEIMYYNYALYKFRHLRYDEFEYYYGGDWILPAGQPRNACDYLMMLYDMEAYSISNDSGEGVYRFDFVQKKVKPRETQHDHSEPVHIIRLFFDLKSLRLIQQKGGFILRDGLREYYRHDYEAAENGSPILVHFQKRVMRGQEVLVDFSVQLIKDK